MKTIRLLYPDYVSGGLETYYFGANLLQHILPSNPDQSTIKVDILPPDGKEKQITNGIYAEEEVLAGIKNAQEKLSEEKPDRVITMGGNCIVSLAPFDYLHGIYENVGNYMDRCTSGCIHSKGRISERPCTWCLAV